jgi:hypothetical protein
LSRIKKIFKESSLTKGLYIKLKNSKKEFVAKKKLNSDFQFANRKQDSNVLVLILAGYKDFLWLKVFSRIEKNLPDNADVCVVSSGLYVEQLDQICQKNNWSYLSVKRNCVTLAQNIAINLHKEAEMIYKIDEDIFITENFFENLMKTYNHANHGQFEVGFVAPLIPINGYGHVRVLEKLNLIEEFESRFGKVKYASRPDRKIESDPQVAQFFWGKDGMVPSIDKIDEQFAEKSLEYRACPIRFSIGAILFPRRTWSDMGMFDVKSGPCMGLDEEQMDQYCMIQSKPMIVSENTCVGHLSFGPQNQEMKKYFSQHKELF